jgi:hypothetical protein
MMQWTTLTPFLKLIDKDKENDLFWQDGGTAHTTSSSAPALRNSFGDRIVGCPFTCSPYLMPYLMICGVIAKTPFIIKTIHSKRATIKR